MNFKSQLASLTLVVGASFAQAQPTNPAPTMDAQVDISSVFVPSGFGDNEPYAVVSGLFPNSCYRWKSSQVTHVSPFIHEVRATATVRLGMCLMVIVPFTEEASLGKLEAGKHTLRFMGRDGTYIEKSVTVD